MGHFYADGGTAPARSTISAPLALFSEAGDVEAQAVTRSYLALVHWAMGDLDRAQSEMQVTISEYERLGVGWPLTREIGNLGLVYLSVAYSPTRWNVWSVS